MGRKAVDLTNRRFGMLVAKERVKSPNGDKKSYWLCECECGNTIITRKDSLENGHAKSCGYCLPNSGKLKHGYSRTRLYSAYSSMKDRCYNPKANAYPLYGGRGITVCDEWLNDPQKFFQWSYENGYEDGKSRAEQSIDRINNDGNYEPSNCRWTDKDTQNYNKRDTRKVYINGGEKTLFDLHNEYGISITTLRTRYTRYKRGQISIEQLVSNEKLINKPQQIIITVDGISHNLSEWERETGISRKTIANRYKKGARSYDELFKKSR